MCQVNPNCRKKETIVYESPKAKIIMCRCGYSSIDEKEDLLKSEMIQIEYAIEEYNKS